MDLASRRRVSAMLRDTRRGQEANGVGQGCLEDAKVTRHVRSPCLANGGLYQRSDMRRCQRRLEPIESGSQRNAPVAPMLIRIRALGALFGAKFRTTLAQDFGPPPGGPPGSTTAPERGLKAVFAACACQTPLCRMRSAPGQAAFSRARAMRAVGPGKQRAIGAQVRARPTPERA